MPNFRVSLQPGIIRNPDDVITIRFSSPRTANNVTVTLIEMDSWSYRRDTMAEQRDDQSDSIAVFTGTIDRGKFQVQECRPAQNAQNAPILKFKFHGSDTEYRLPIPDADTQEEGGELEIGLQVRGEIPQGRRVLEKEYTTPSPVFVRNCGPAGGQRRPLITFITGRDAFYNAGKRYWEIRADGLIKRKSVEEILSYLGTQQNLQNYGEGRWGEVNIVSHANSNQWIIQLFAGRRQQKLVDINVLNQYGNDPRLQAPGAGVVDNTTRVVIRGCVIGTNQTLLDRIRRLFGGQAFVYAPKYLQWYEWYQRGRERTQREFFFEFFFFYVVGSRSPNERICIDTLSQKYFNVGIDEAEWRNLLRGRGERKRKDTTELFRYTLEYNDEPPRAREDQLAELRRRFPNDERTFNTTADDWQWRTRRQVNRRRNEYRVVFTGSRRRVEVRRPLRDNNGNIVVPNITDRSHYGRSPGW